MNELDEIKAILLQTAQQQASLQQQLIETRQIADSNARSIQANSNAISELVTEMRESITDTVGMIGNLAHQADEDRQLIREMQSEVRGLQTQGNRILERLFGNENRTDEGLQ